MCERYLEHYYKMKPTSGFDPAVCGQDDPNELRAIIDGGGKM